MCVCISVCLCAVLCCVAFFRVVIRRAVVCGVNLPVYIIAICDLCTL